MALIPYIPGDYRPPYTLDPGPVENPFADNTGNQSWQLTTGTWDPHSDLHVLERMEAKINALFDQIEELKSMIAFLQDVKKE